MLGPTGPAGGPVGNTGIGGNTGLQGVTGPFGGPVGNTGLIGATGIQGIQGNTGFGIQGNTGVVGSTGIQGFQGNTGIVGFTGPIGTTGAYGGPQGMTGPFGNTGLIGSTGLQGSTGLALGGNISTEPQGWVSGSTYQLPSTANKIQNINPTVVNTLLLPTTNIQAGDLFHITNRSSNDVTIQSSAGNTIDVIRTGYIKCRALIASPIANTDWYVEDVKESVSLSFVILATGSCFADTQNITMTVMRNNGLLTYYIPQTVDTANSVIASSFASTTSFIPTRLIPYGATGSGSDYTIWWNSSAVNRISGGTIIPAGDTVVQISLSGTIRFTAATVWSTSNANGFPAYTLNAYV